MAKRLPSVDVVLVGFGWTASILAKELTDTGLRVVAIERGGFRDTVPDFAPTTIQDELRYAVRNGLFEEPHRETLTFRNDRSQTALPMRKLGSFRPAAGTGGAGVHWNGQNWRFLPTDFTIRSHYTQRYGKNFIPADMTIQDWGVTYEELEPHYDAFEYLCGISGKAGNLAGTIQPGGNPFEGPRKRNYPLPPLKRCHATALFDAAAREVGLHPFPAPAANTSKPYTEPLRRADGRVHLLRLLRMVRVRQLFEVEPASVRLSRAAGARQFRAAHAMQRDARQGRCGRARRRRGLRGRDRRGVGAARRARDPLRVRAAQRAPAAALGHRHAVRPGRQRRRGGTQLRLPDHLGGRGLHGQEPQPVHGRGRIGPDRRRLQRRQLRPRAAPLRRRRLHRALEHRRAADPAALRARGHAELGLEVQARPGGELPQRRQDRDPRQRA